MLHLALAVEAFRVPAAYDTAESAATPYGDANGTPSSRPLGPATGVRNATARAPAVPDLFLPTRSPDGPGVP